jgi:hypothetical protein
MVIGHDVASSVDDETRAQTWALPSWCTASEETLKKVFKGIAFFSSEGRAHAWTFDFLFRTDVYNRWSKCFREFYKGWPLWLGR